MFAVLLVDLGLALTGSALVMALLPTPPLGLTRISSLGVAGVGMVLFLVGLLWPARAWRSPGPLMAGLDAAVPVCAFGEHHETRVLAPTGVVYAAVRAVTAREILLFRFLTYVRSPHLGGAPEGILNPHPDLPILEVATRGEFVLLHEDEGREVVFGALLPPGRHAKPTSSAEFHERQGSLSRAVMNFHLDAEGGGTTRLVTETRIAPSDTRAGLQFGAYWRLIYPGSAFIRRAWLLAIKRRAESAAGKAPA